MNTYNIRISTTYNTTTKYTLNTYKDCYKKRQVTEKSTWQEFHHVVA